ncbi:VV A32-like virion packaging ATPase [Pandoravirus inopinatum]|uniref:VV A32-like virion packaging ATPase n=1 Tax=Pandoravirus inopinatum TaxID=1605721 RepID=A0A0B5JEK0_9VIRU|nr:VV A32-like virion packaging ATPase [Pandoravirus inopinatum]AJF98192.1 VV A32-like virion packaging ATPase [Pandoravirus inopinatum]
MGPVGNDGGGDSGARPSRLIADTNINNGDFSTIGHLKILFLNIVQYVMDVPKAIRSQIDYVFALREPQRAYRENLYKNFFGIFPTYEEFSAAFDACTENFGCIVVDSTARTNAIEDSVFWYRGSPNPPKFILGNRNFWKLHYMFYKAPVHALSDDDIIPALAHKYKASKPTEEPSADKEKERPRKSGKKRRRDAIVVKKRDVDGAIIIEDTPPVAAPPPAVTSTEAPSAGAPAPSGPIAAAAVGPVRPPVGSGASSHHSHHHGPLPQSSHPPPPDRCYPPPAAGGPMAGPPAMGARPPVAGNGPLPPRQNTPRPPFEFGPPRPPSAIMAAAMRAPAPRPFPQ